MSEYLVLSTSSYQHLAEKVVAQSECNTRLLTLETKRFPDGERYHRLKDSVVARHVIIVGGTIDDQETMELFDLACMAQRWGAWRIRLIIPYFGYQTMERAAKSGEDVKAKNRALLLSSIPKPPDGVKIFALDLHQEGIPEYFSNAVQCIHVYAESLMLGLFASIARDKNAVLACTDAGRLKWITSYAKKLSLPVAVVLKNRISGSQTEEIDVHANVQDKHVIMYDDMIRTGGSLIGAASALRDRGAEMITAVATHGVLPGDSLKRLQTATGSDKKPLFDRVVVTDSHPAATKLAAENDFLQIQSIAKVLALAAFTEIGVLETS